MNNFYHYSPTKIIFGRGMLNNINKELVDYKKILLLYGKGSIKDNGIYNQVMSTLAKENCDIFEYAGIGENPEFEICWNVVKLVKEKKIDFILAVGGGSVIDAAKFISLVHESKSPENAWNIVLRKQEVPNSILPLGCILTVPGTGTEINKAFVISRKKKEQKLSFYDHSLFPKFSILDPEFTFSLSKKQTAYGIVDTFMHVLEQYMTKSDYVLLQDRQSEAILKTLIETAKPLLEKLNDYDLRSTVMWCSTQAQDGTISRGVNTDWATHEIGHILTASYNIPHAQTLSVTFGNLYKIKIEEKKSKLVQYGKRIWNLEGEDEDIAYKSIDLTEKFFEELGLYIKIEDLGISKIELSKKIRDYYRVNSPNHIDIESACKIFDEGNI